MLRRAHALQTLLDSYRTRVTGIRSSSLLPKLVDSLFDTPTLTIGSAQHILGVTHRAAAVLAVTVPWGGRVVPVTGAVT